MINANIHVLRRNMVRRDQVNVLKCINKAYFYAVGLAKRDARNM